MKHDKIRQFATIDVWRCSKSSAWVVNESTWQNIWHINVETCWKTLQTFELRPWQGKCHILSRWKSSVGGFHGDARHVVPLEPSEPNESKWFDPRNVTFLRLCRVYVNLKMIHRLELQDWWFILIYWWFMQLAARSTLPALTVAVNGSLTRPLGDRRQRQKQRQRRRQAFVSSSCLMTQMTQMTQNHKDHRRVIPRFIWVYKFEFIECWLNICWLFADYFVFSV